MMNRLNGRLEAFLKKIAPYSDIPCGPECLLEGDSFEEVLRISTYLEELKEAGLVVLPGTYEGISRRSPQKRVTVSLPEWFSLTSKGEGYFEEVRKSEREERKKRWSDRRWQLLTIVVSVLLSAVVSLVVALLNNPVHLA